MTTQIRLQLQYVVLPFVVVLSLPYVNEHLLNFEWFASVGAAQIGVLVGAASSGLRRAAKLYGVSDEPAPSTEVVAAS